MLALTGCSVETLEEDGSEQSEEEKIRIGMIFDTFVVERWQRDRDVFVSTAMELGAEVNVQNANGDVQEQVAQMEYFIGKKVDVIVVVPIESSALVKSIKKAKEEGIKVISYDRLTIGAGTDLYVSFDNETVGQLMGEAVCSKLERGDKILMICGPNSDNNVSFVERGFRKELKQNGIEVADIYYADEWRAEYGAEYIEQYGDGLHEIQAVMCGNDNLAGQVIRVLAEKRMAGDICVVAQDADLDACQRIVEGTQYMTVYKPVEKLAVQAAEAAVELAQGKPVQTTDYIDDGIYRIPYIKLEPIAVTAENMDETIIKSGFHLAEDVYLNRPEMLMK
ncbi:MAG: sugar ABC transporter substrate-binding protein [Lachnospiraceae bacterium]|nr:sugar ABC transporter substrate-binding protein [Lachnospiraceae bacterium]